MRRFTGVLAQADALYVPFRSNYFHSVIFSPPYWGLRVYSGKQGFEPFGLEATPERHIERMVEVCREAGRVLRPDGVFWLIYGDTYFGDSPVRKNSSEAFSETRDLEQTASRGGDRRSAARIGNLKAGSLALMPHKIAIALQEDGWIVRNDLVWYKRNPMPTPANGWRWERHRLKVRSADVDWKKEARRTDRPLEGGAHVGGGNTGFLGHSAEWVYCDGCEKCEPHNGYILRKGSWRHTRSHENIFQFTKGMQYYCNQEEAKEPSRNPHSVIDVPTASYGGKHFATFPPDLIAPLIRASVPSQSCPICGAPYAPMVERDKHPTRDAEAQRKESIKATGRTDGKTMGPSGMMDETRVSGYMPTCEHEGDPIPGIVLDMFGGSGTTGMVAKQLMRRWAIMDISMPYIDEQAKIRTGTGTPSKALDDLPLFSGDWNDD